MKNYLELLRKLMPAMQTHLDASLPKIRRLGMVVAEKLTEALNDDGNTLKFEVKMMASSIDWWLIKHVILKIAIFISKA